MKNKTLRLGSRRSPLAVHQANTILHCLKASNRFDKLELVFIDSEGDEKPNLALNQIGGKGVFTKRLEDALLDHKIDLAIHSFKDLTSSLSPSSQLVGFYCEDEIEDCVAGFIPFEEMRQIATSSLRRKLFLRHHYPHLDIVDIRGNVGSRLNKCKHKDMGVMLSKVGLTRLGLQDYIKHVFPANLSIPAPGQGVIAVQARQGCDVLNDVQASLVHSKEWMYFCYYDLMKALEFNCQIPLGAHLYAADKKGYQLQLCCGSFNLQHKKNWLYSIDPDNYSDVLKGIAVEVQAWLKNPI